MLYYHKIICYLLLSFVADWQITGKLTIFVDVMKHEYDISRQRQDDLIKAYNRVALSCWSQRDAYMKAVKEPAPRYYVSPKQALQIISPMVKGDFEMVNLMMPNKKRMYYSLFEKVMELSEKRNFIGKSLYYIVQFAVCEPAPEFFMSHKTFESIRSWMKNGKIDDEGRVLNYPSREKQRERQKLIRMRKKEYLEKLRKSTP